MTQTRRRAVGPTTVLSVRVPQAQADAIRARAATDGVAVNRLLRDTVVSTLVEAPRDDRARRLPRFRARGGSPEAPEPRRTRGKARTAIRRSPRRAQDRPRGCRGDRASEVAEVDREPRPSPLSTARRYAGRADPRPAESRSPADRPGASHRLTDLLPPPRAGSPAIERGTASPPAALGARPGGRKEQDAHGGQARHLLRPTALTDLALPLRPARTPSAQLAKVEDRTGSTGPAGAKGATSSGWPGPQRQLIHASEEPPMPNTPVPLQVMDLAAFGSRTRAVTPALLHAAGSAMSTRPPSSPASASTSPTLTSCAHDHPRRGPHPRGAARPECKPPARPRVPLRLATRGDRQTAAAAVHAVEEAVRTGTSTLDAPHGMFPASWS